MGCGAGTVREQLTVEDKIQDDSAPEQSSASGTSWQDPMTPPKPASQPPTPTGNAWQDDGSPAPRKMLSPPSARGEYEEEDPMDLTLESVCGPTIVPLGTTVGSPAPYNQPLRILLIRHALSKGSGGGMVTDPELSNLGVQQAQRLGAWLRHELEDSFPMFVSSPMRRCIHTVMPAVTFMGLPKESFVCHGAAYELACAGTELDSSNQQDLEAEFSVRCVGFKANGWDYQGNSLVETEAELIYRVRRLIWWLEKDAFNFPILLGRPDVENPVLVLCMHETILDLIVRILVDAEPILEYDGKVKNKMKNSFITELSRSTSGNLTVTRSDSGEHMRFAVQPLMA